MLVADDVAGGFIAINGGALGTDPGNIYYLAPYTLEWEGLEIGFTDFFPWSLSRKLNDIYAELRCPGCEADLASVAADRCMQFYPPLWTAEGSVDVSHRGEVPVDEAFVLAMEIRSQMADDAK